MFVLREVFDYSYKEIGEIIAKSEAACRQLMARAHAALARAQQSPRVQTPAMSPVVSRFIEAMAQGDEKCFGCSRLMRC